MDQGQDMTGWCGRILACDDIGAAARALASALGVLSGGETAGVFLLDVDKSRLLLSGSWSRSAGEKAETLQAVSLDAKTPQAVPLDEAGDPLCFCLLSGAPYRAVINPTATMDLLNLKRGPVFAMPLKARTGGTLGGVLVAGPCERADALQALCMYAALIMENMLLKKNESSTIAELRGNLTRLTEQTRQTEQAERLATTHIVGSSRAMHTVRSLIVRAAPANAAVLITGETGTGKEATAEAIHQIGPRGKKPFLKINCGALSPQLLESELFGHVKGAFTGAEADYAGLLRGADGGSVLLDEIGDMPVELQVKLLRVLQDKRVRPVGGVGENLVDIRVMAATNQDLRAAMREGRFRQDLYHRIAALDIHIPPLRERRQDIPELAAHFFAKLCAAHDRKDLRLSQEGLLHLSLLPLPGNARELNNLIERAILLSDPGDGSVSFDALAAGNPGIGEKKLPLGAMLNAYERDVIKCSLERHCGNITKAAETLCIPRTTLRAKIRKFNLEQNNGYL